MGFTSNQFYEKMRQIVTSRTISIPNDVEISLKSRRLCVKGPRGTLSREFHFLNVNMFLVTEPEKTSFKADLYLANREQLANLRTLCSHVSNMIDGVTKGFMYKMRTVYAHFPINLTIDPKGKTLEIRNFIGEKKVRTVDMLHGVICERSSTLKDELILTGIDLELVSRSAALICQACLVKGKDIRKFLDGIYVSEKTHITE